MLLQDDSYDRSFMGMAPPYARILRYINFYTEFTLLSFQHRFWYKNECHPVIAKRSSTLRCGLAYLNVAQKCFF